MNRSLRSEYQALEERAHSLTLQLAKLAAHVDRLVREKEILLKERAVTEETMGRWIAEKIRSPLE